MLHAFNMTGFKLQSNNQEIRKHNLQNSGFRRGRKKPTKWKGTTKQKLHKHYKLQIVLKA